MGISSVAKMACDYDKVNKPIKRIDAYEKVTGKAKFGADLSFPNMLYGKVLRSKYPYAQILFVMGVTINEDKVVEKANKISQEMIQG